MTTPAWDLVDAYIRNTLVPADAVLEETLQATAEGGLPMQQVSWVQGKFLHVLARSCGARRILEIGTLGGFSAIWLGRALPENGKMLCLELLPQNAAVARANLERAGLAGRVEVRVGKALDLLPLLAGEALPPFDFTFIDANKENSPEYFDWAVKLSRPGSLIVVDNVVRKGALADPGNTEPSTLGARRLHETLATDPRICATTLQTVDAKGHDGMILAVVA